MPRGIKKSKILTPEPELEITPEPDPEPEPEITPEPDPEPEPEITPEEIKREKARLARQRHNEIKKQKQLQLKETATTVKDDLELLKQNMKLENEKIKKELQLKHDQEMEDLRQELTDLKFKSKKERSLKRVEIYGEPEPEPEEPKLLKQIPYLSQNPFNTIWR